MKNQHQICLAPGELEHTTEFLDACNVHRTPAVSRPPVPNGPPVQGLVISSGIACKESDCAYACINHDTMVRHARDIHAYPYEGESQPKVFLQTLFHSPIEYFRVNLALSNSQSPDLISALGVTFIAEATQPPPRLTAERDGDTTPLHQLLGSVRTSQESTQQLSSLKRAHTPEEDGGIYERLAHIATVWIGMVPEMLKGNTIQLDLTRVIIYGPAHMPHGV